METTMTSVKESIDDGSIDRSLTDDDSIDDDVMDDAAIEMLSDDDLLAGLSDVARRLCLRIQQDDPTLRFLSIHGSLDFMLACGKMMATNTHLRDLTLVSLTLTKRVAQVLAYGIRKSRVEELTIEGSVCVFGSEMEGEEEFQELREILYGAIQSSPTIRSIHWSDVCDLELNYFLPNVLSSLKTLKELTIDSCQDVSVVTQMLVDHLDKSSSLTSLTLFAVGTMAGSDIRRLLRSLQHNRSLQTLSLNGANIDDAAVQVLIDHWPPARHSTPLRNLDLSQNVITIHGMRLLMNALLDGRLPLEELDVGCNYDIGCEGLLLMADAIPHLPTLKRVGIARCVRWTMYPNRNCREAREQDELFGRTGQALLMAVQQNSHIEYIKTWSNGFPETLEQEIAFYAYLNRHGRYLLRSGNNEQLDITTKLWSHVLDRCQRLDRRYGTSLMYYFLCQQPNLVPLLSRKRKRVQQDSRD